MRTSRSRKANSSKRFSGFLLALLMLPLTAAAAHGEEPLQPLLKLLPHENRLNGWRLDGTPDTAANQELYLLINGGAEIYVQEGFQQAVLASYTHADGRVVNVEIYEMASVEGARAVQRRKISPNGKAIAVGEEAVLEGYFLNLRHGRFQATLSGYDSREETVAVLLKMGRLVVDNIKTRP